MCGLQEQRESHHSHERVEVEEGGWASATRDVRNRAFFFFTDHVINNLHRRHQSCLFIGIGQLRILGISLQQPC